MMTLKKRIAIVCFGLNVLYMTGAGLVFVLSDEFLGIHSDVIQTAWQDLETAVQTLYLGMMRTEGAGFLASALAMAILLVIPFRQGQAWSGWAIAAIGIVEHVPTLLANYHVATTTPSSPPWQAVLAMITLLVLGGVLSQDDSTAVSHQS